ncbi:uncharacterized protein LOC125230652 isoform X3 [Leguminivora glycinivorella]|uniref:uncharacterized protein LOC125230652 isoform X3 n=1 Tax=Leguminivora glycinivorella TaxID=1035111 RepID=UPI00200C6625|nr:uncharacterized protein LOC125230652 isoform X3 [Leguminivora glycinivorella]
MAKSVSFNANCNLSDSYLEEAAKWLSCNGEVWGVGPTLLFAAAAALFLHQELQASLFGPGDHPNVTMLEHILVTAMIVGTLALMVHIWVCLMRFFQYYLDTLIRDSPNVLLEMTTAGLLGSSQKELAALGPLTRFLRQQQPQIHITLCWLLALCYADYIRKHYCTRFNLPYLEQWQEELHAMAGRRAHDALSAAHSFAAVVRSRLRSLAPQPPTNEAHTVTDKGSRTALSGCSSTLAGRCRASEVEMCVHDARAVFAGDELQKLRAYIKATRCSCAGAVSSTRCSVTPVPTPPGAASETQSCTGVRSATTISFAEESLIRRRSNTW